MKFETFHINYEHLGKVLAAKFKYEYLIGKPLKIKLGTSIKTTWPTL